MAETRKFGGRIYTLDTVVGSERGTVAIKKLLQDNGNSVRVVRRSDGKHKIYIRKAR